MSLTANLDTPCGDCGRTAEDNQRSHKECRKCAFTGCYGCVIDHELVEHSSDVVDDIDYEEPLDDSSYHDALQDLKDGGYCD